jgi:hypothetical protein
LAPSLIAAACYATFSRIIWWVTPQERRQIRLLWCPLQFVAPISIGLVLIASLFTLIGAGIAATTYLKESLLEKLPQEGLALLQMGLILQLVGLLTFSSIAIQFMLVSRHWMDISPPSAAHLRVGWRGLGWTVITAILLLTVSRDYNLGNVVSNGRETDRYLQYIELRSCIAL